MDHKIKADLTEILDPKTNSIVSVPIDINAHFLNAIWSTPTIAFLCFAAWQYEYGFVRFCAGLTLGMYLGLLYNLVFALLVVRQRNKKNTYTTHL